MKRHLWLAFCAALLALVAGVSMPRTASANGGQPILTDDEGPYSVIISATPWPANPGSIHLSMVVTRAKSSDPVGGATVIYSPDMSGMAMSDTKPLRAYPGSRPNIYDVDIPLSMDGQWTVTVQITGALGDASFTVHVPVEKPTPPWGLIIGLLVGLPLLAGGSYFFLFRKGATDEDDG